MTRRIHVIGIGAGDPDYVTAEAVRALNDTAVFFAMDKGEAKNDLVALRRQICERFIVRPGYRFVELADPQRAKDANYRQAVAQWHSARAAVWADAIERELAPEGVGAFLAWGDPSLYDSTLRILELVAQRVEISYDVIPGITAIQALTARHRIPLNDIGEPVLITTGRRLAADGLAGSVVVMLDGDCAFRRARRRPASGGAPTSARPTSCWCRAPSARSARRSSNCAPRHARGTAGSWTRICCGRHTDRQMAFLLRAALTGFALWIVTLVVSGIDFVGGDTTLQRVGIILVVAVVFGLVNAIIKPIVQLISIPLYILTLGLFHVVINALMLWITSWITENTTHWGLYIDDFWWTAIWAAIVLSFVSWALSLIVRTPSA